MTEQFFPRQTEDFRVRVAAATTDVIKFKLMELQSEGERVGALMLYENDQSVGLYNLCVASKMRGLGVGATMTRWAIDYAYHQRKMITLQCDARLQTWYEEQSFDWVGTVDVYSLSNRPKSDIMNGT
jgi:predicted GNAT family acetyltransferase